jgi:hypothetical protein
MHGPICIFWANLTPFSLREIISNVDVGLRQVVAMTLALSTSPEIIRWWAGRRAAAAMAAAEQVL